MRKTQTELTRNWRDKNKAHWNAYMRTWRRKNKKRAAVLAKQSHARHYKKASRVAARRRWHLKKAYGITLEQYNEMLAAQGGVCAICRQPEVSLRRGSFKSLDVDHNHDTGDVRGLLCGACNAALGLLKEDPERIIALFDYVVEHNG